MYMFYSATFVRTNVVVLFYFLISNVFYTYSSHVYTQHSIADYYWEALSGKARK